MKTEEVFRRLGFEEIDCDLAPGQRAYAYDFGNGSLQAIPVTNLYLRPVFQLVGTIADRRSMLYIESELPLQVDSYEQGVAMLAAAVGRAAE